MKEKTEKLNSTFGSQMGKKSKGRKGLL